MTNKCPLNKLLDCINERPWVGIGLLTFSAIAYSSRALLSPFWVGNDAWSNLLPVIHFRDSIINNHSLPLYTELWYGGRSQWANPLWSFFYVPATIIQLIFPLDWGVRIVYLGHLIFIVLAARKLASLFFNTEFEKIAAAIIMTSPMLPAFTAGQNEKIMSWGWVLLAVYFLFNEKLPLSRRGVTTGICLGIIPLTGSNYYALYLGMLLGLLVLSYKNRKIFSFFLLGSIIGLLHIPSVLHLIGQERGNPETSINQLSISFTGLLSSLSIGIADPIGWETWAPIGIPTMYVFFSIIILKAKSLVVKKQTMITKQQMALFSAIIILALFVTGIAYKAIPLLKLFRVPSRALPFIALAVALFTFIEISKSAAPRFRNFFFLISILQLCVFSYMIKPYGALYSPYDSQAQHVADILNADGAKQVWISMQDELNSMYIQTSFNRNGLGLPNVYYGDMGQVIKIDGNDCGYSFDHLVAIPSAENKQHIELTVDIEWSNTRGKIPLSDLALIQQVQVHGISYNIYRVVCESQQE